MSRKVTRRGFLKGAAAGGLSFVFLKDSSAVFGYGANEKLNIAIIGCGGKGKSNRSAVAGENIVAVCDVSEAEMADALRDHPGSKPFSDFRVMLDRMGREIDAVVISTPDHTHAPAAAMAIKMGKHVYCEKPLTKTIHECRVVRDLARRHKVATQMGNQGTASSGLRQAVEIIRSGALGQVFEVHAWTDRPIWPQGIDRPAETPPVPSDLRWDLWLGPAPARPYNPAYHPFKWRGWIDFGTGALGDMGCHIVNLPFMALDLRNPISVEAEVREMTDETYPKQSVVTYLFRERRDLRTCRVKWYDGKLKPSPDVLADRELPGNGVVIIGNKGRMFIGDAYGSNVELLPKDRFEGYTPPPETLPRSPGHHQEWIRACKGGEPAMSNFDYACDLTEMVLLGNLAILTGEPIYWEADRMRATNCPRADRYIQYEYRKGWEL